MERIFYEADTKDAYTNLPIYVFDTSFLPSPDLINYDEFIPTLMNVLPKHPYVLVMLSCGLNKISWIWGIKFLKTFLSSDNKINNLDNLNKIITVHDSWFVKSITQILTNYNFTKKNLSSLNKAFESFNNFNLSDSFNQVSNNSSVLLSLPPNLVINCSTLSQLTFYIDIRRLKLSLNVYKHNLLLEPNITFTFPINHIINDTTKINQHLNPIFFHHFYQIFNIINLFGDKVELIFHKPGNKANTDILYQCIKRNQLIWINDWDLYCIATTFKKLLMDLPQPLISASIVSLPIKNNFENTLSSFNKLMSHYNKFEDNNYGMVLYQLLQLCSRIISNPSLTKHTSLSMSKCLSYCISQELISLQNKDRVLIITRIFKNYLDFWPQIQPLYQEKFPSIDQIIKGEELDQNKLDDSYDLSYDITMEEEEEEEEGSQSEEEVNKTFTPTTVLGNNNNLINQLQKQQKNQNITPLSSPNKTTPPTPKSNSPVTSKQNDRPTQHEKKPSLGNSTFQFPAQKSKLNPVKKPSVTSLNSAHSSSLSSVNSYSASVSTTSSSVSTSSQKNANGSNMGNNHLRTKSSFTFNQGQISHSSTPSLSVKKPVIRGRKVGELAKLYEERCQGIELLRSM